MDWLYELFGVPTSAGLPLAPVDYPGLPHEYPEDQSNLSRNAEHLQKTASYRDLQYSLSQQGYTKVIVNDGGYAGIFAPQPSPGIRITVTVY